MDPQLLFLFLTLLVVLKKKISSVTLQTLSIEQTALPDPAYKLWFESSFPGANQLKKNGSNFKVRGKEIIKKMCAIVNHFDWNQCLLTWFVIVKHQEEVDQPRQLHRLEHLPDEAQLAEIYHEPGLLLRNLSQGKVFHRRDKIL